MKQKKFNDVPINQRITVSVDTLAKMLDCGRATAVKIGTEAGDRVQIGSRVLFHVDTVRRYIDGLITKASAE